MARIAVKCMYVWYCPDCETSLKAGIRATVVASSEYHMLRVHGIIPTHWDPPIELVHWAFHVIGDNNLQPVA